MTFRNRTSLYDIGCALYLYFSGLSTRSVAKVLYFLNIVKRSHVSIWKWIQKYQPRIRTLKRKSIYEFIVDETMIKVGSELIWLWLVAIEPAENKQILALSISKEREKHVCCWWKIPVKNSSCIWKPCRNINRWWRHLVSPSLQILKFTASSSFSFWEKPDWKDYAIHKG